MSSTQACCRRRARCKRRLRRRFSRRLSSRSSNKEKRSSKERACNSGCSSCWVKAAAMPLRRRRRSCSRVWLSSIGKVSSDKESCIVLPWSSVGPGRENRLQGQSASEILALVHDDQKSIQTGCTGALAPCLLSSRSEDGSQRRANCFLVREVQRAQRDR